MSEPEDTAPMAQALINAMTDGAAEAGRRSAARYRRTDEHKRFAEHMREEDG